ncbi:MAG: hypothetical protein OES20_00255 [Gammaproteobacteria bacterium]|nr:hypothetical protein [Gammaproteobacteria bacterium]
MAIAITPLPLSILLSLVACSAGQQRPIPVDRPQTACVDPRPQICTMDYTPVCAELRSGELKTYSNACSACADAYVVSYRLDPCVAES